MNGGNTLRHILCRVSPVGKGRRIEKLWFKERYASWDTVGCDLGHSSVVRQGSEAIARVRGLE